MQKSTKGNEPYFKKRLRDELANRQRANPSYSLRAFARALGLQPAVLSDVFNDKRNLPVKNAKAVCQKLLFSPQEVERFMGSIEAVKSGKGPVASDTALPEDYFKILEENEANFKVIAEWEHYAVLELTQIKGFRSDAEWIAKRLGSTKLRIAAVLGNLSAAGLIAIDKVGHIKVLQSSVTTTNDQASIALQQAHKEALELGSRRLAEVDVDQRDYSLITMPVEKASIAAMKKEIRDFRRQLLKKYGQSKSGQEVYQMCVQLYPLTNDVGSDV